MSAGEPTWELVKRGVRSLAASFPVAASLAQAWNEYESHVQVTRTDEFFRRFGEQLQRVENRMRVVEDHAKKSGELPALLELAVEKAVREVSEEKRATLAVFSANALALGPALPSDEKVSLLHTLDTLTTRDLRVLSGFRNNARLFPGEMTGRVEPGHPDDQLAQVASSLAKLQARGLIYECSDPAHPTVTYNVQDRGSIQFIWGRKQFAPMPVAQNLLLILDLQPKPGETTC